MTFFFFSYKMHFLCIFVPCELHGLLHDEALCSLMLTSPLFRHLGRKSFGHRSSGDEEVSIPDWCREVVTPGAVEMGARVC